MLQRNDDDFDCLPSAGIPQFQVALYSVGLSLLRKAFPGLVSYNRFVEGLSDMLLRRRAIIESVIDQLKNISQIVREACRRQTFASSIARQLPSQLSLRVDCLLPLTQEALSAH